MSQVLEKTKPGYKIYTWGCQMNEEDSEQMGLYLERLGYRPVQDEDCLLYTSPSPRD